MTVSPHGCAVAERFLPPLFQSRYARVAGRRDSAASSRTMWIGTFRPPFGERGRRNRLATRRALREVGSHA
jgi:hypothetical protein